MAVVNQILHRKNSSGSYDTIYLKANMANVTGVLSPEHGGTGASEITEVEAVNVPEPYVHPATIQCNATPVGHTHVITDITDMPDVTNHVVTQDTDTKPAELDTGTISIGPNRAFLKFNRDYTIPAVGTGVTFDNKSWIICHIDTANDFVYLIAKDIISKTIFGSNTTYSGSELSTLSSNYEINQMSAAALAQCFPVTVNGVTSKVFVPSYEQMNGGFSWFSNNTNRIAKYNGTSTAYWTSSAYNTTYPYNVSNYGIIGKNVTISTECGFRPAICVSGKIFDDSIFDIISAIGIHGHGCRIAFGSYTGNGKYGSSNPNSLTFDFYPVAVIIGCDEHTDQDNASNPTVLLRGRAYGTPDSIEQPGTSHMSVRMNLTWNNNGVSWYNSASGTFQNNASGEAYCYVVLGYD